MSSKVHSYNVWVEDINNREIVTYDVMPSFIRFYEAIPKNKKPKTFDEFKEFVKNEGMYHYWCKCEWEIVLVEWPYDEKDPMKNSKKIDVWQQINANMGVFVQLLMESVIK